MTILGLCAAAVVRFTYFGKDDPPTDPFFYLLTFYLIPFAGLLLVAQIQWQRVLKYFQFLGFLYGKGLFMIFVALLLFDTQYPVDTAISIFMTLVGLFNLLVMCLAPGYVLQTSFFGKSAKDGETADSRSEDDYDDNSENDADEHDGLLPRTTYLNDGGNNLVHRNLSNKPE